MRRRRMPPSPETLDVSGRAHDPAGPREAANPLGLSQAMILCNASAEIMRRGEEYVGRGAVGALVLRGNVLTAEVEGSEDEPYRVSVTLNGPSGPAVDVAEASCDCPYDWGGWCKHIVAVVLAAVRAAPGEVERAPAVEELLASLDAAGLRALIAGLVKNDPRRADEVAALVERQQQRPAAKGQAATVPAAPDTARLRRQVRAALRSLGRMDDSQAYWQVGRVVGEVRALAESEASERLQAGDGRGALVVLEAVTDAYAKDWTDLDDSDGDASNFFFDIAPLWTEAVLTAVDDLSQAERTAWARKLDGWQRALEDYGVDDVFHAPIEAARRGWDAPDLSAVLGVEKGAQAPNEGRTLMTARLNVLERQGRHEESLLLALAAEQHARVALLLAALNRPGEAAAYALARPFPPGDAHQLAERLQQAGENDFALQVAEHGLGRERDAGADPDGDEAERWALAAWLAEFAAGQGRPDLALRAAMVAFREQPDLSAWQRLQTLAPAAGDDWPALREGLLTHAGHVLGDRNEYKEARGGALDVLLREERRAEALRAAVNSGDRVLLARAADAALLHLPEDVLRASRRAADEIMGGGQSAHYDEAARWLERAHAALHALGRAHEWRELRTALLETHRRKYKLVPLLRALPQD